MRSKTKLFVFQLLVPLALSTGLLVLTHVNNQNTPSFVNVLLWIFWAVLTLVWVKYVLVWIFDGLPAVFAQMDRFLAWLHRDD